MYTGKLVKLRAYRKEDLVTVTEFFNDPEVKSLTRASVPYLLTLEDEERWFESNSANNDVYSFAIEALDTGEYIGSCGINEVDWKNSHVTVFDFNTRAQKCYEKCGFKVEGVLRESIFTNGRYVNEIVMGLLRSEYKA